MPAANPAQKKQWKHRLEQWQSSGLQPREWCQKHDLLFHRFYYWRRKLMPPPKTPNENLSKFVELTDNNHSMTGISIEYHGVTVHLSREFHPESLIRCLQAVWSI